MNGTIRIHQTKALISGRKTLSPQDMAPMYILARDIDDRKTTAAMRLRLIRTYDIVQSRYSDRVRSRECVFHDEEGSYVHLNIPGNNVSAANSFIEGHVYCLKNFLVISPIYTYRTCSSDFMLQYYHKTLVKQYKGLDFPRKMFRLQPFDSIKSLEGIDPKVLIDVIGRVVHIFSPLDKLINGRPSKLIDFVIEDLKGIQLECTVWDQHVEKVIPFCQYDLKEPVIVLIQMCRVKVPENTEELKAMQPKINVERDRLEKRNLAFPVMQIKDDIAVVNEYCPGMLKVTNQKSTNSYEQLDDDFDSDELVMVDIGSKYVLWFKFSRNEPPTTTNIAATSIKISWKQIRLRKQTKQLKTNLDYASRQSKMKRLTKSTVIGSKRKQQADNKENENSLGHENSNPTQQSQLSSYKTSRPFCGVFQASLSTPGSVLTNVCSKEVSVRNVSNRTPLSAISSTPTANQVTDLRMESLTRAHTHQTVVSLMKPSLRTPNTVFNNDLTMESLTGTHTHHRVGRVLEPSLPTPNSVLTNENVANNEPHIEAEVGPSTTHAGYTECITNLSKRPSSRLMNANNPSPSDCCNLHNDFNECSEQEDTVTDAQPGKISPHFCNIW
nr:replication protein A 70 kDa DNA-binding subunit B-like [Ipomoea batatas]